MRTDTTVNWCMGIVTDQPVTGSYLAENVEGSKLLGRKGSERDYGRTMRKAALRASQML